MKSINFLFNKSIAWLYKFWWIKKNNIYFSITNKKKISCKNTDSRKLLNTITFNILAFSINLLHSMLYYTQIHEKITTETIWISKFNFMIEN